MIAGGRSAGTLAGAGGTVAAVWAGGWLTGAFLLAATIVVVAATCWVVADDDRPKRLALLIESWRGPARAPRPAVRRGRAARTGSAAGG
ncbi:hypothetical protein [Paractinoplanes atraurantiacus]|uniref:Uncharacterized protein n=1 Tax=Paractinoplanes atraurantiacus TaxID=1036182 RepID=A0A285HRJ5_9ACTN|nr:hypothetical protein [Actinoplanes atraurantiacus]SNY38352.1 hypothetical protein SAMN05421748_105210 [Actinoplanes atraurantiacus]